MQRKNEKTRTGDPLPISEIGMLGLVKLILAAEFEVSIVLISTPFALRALLGAVLLEPGKYIECGHDAVENGDSKVVYDKNELLSALPLDDLFPKPSDEENRKILGLSNTPAGSSVEAEKEFSGSPPEPRRRRRRSAWQRMNRPMETRRSNRKRQIDI